MKKLFAVLVVGLLAIIGLAGCGLRVTSDQEIQKAIAEGKASQPTVAPAVKVESVSKEDLKAAVAAAVAEANRAQPAAQAASAPVYVAPVAPVAPAAPLVASGSCPVVNGVVGSILPPNMCKYFFGSSSQVTVPAGYWADAYRTDTGMAQYGIQAGTTIQTIEVTLKPLATTNTTNAPVAPVASSSMTTTLSANCPTTAAQVASLIGGNVEKWSRPDPTNQPGTWVYSDKGTNVSFSYPGFGTFDTYRETAVHKTVTADITTFKCN